jgi:hypothetical protein
MAQSDEHGRSVSRRTFFKAVGASPLAAGVLSATLAEAHSANVAAPRFATGGRQRTGVPDAAEIEALVGHQFPGGHYTVAHWENFLLTECTGGELLPDGMVHPVVMFHMPIIGAGTSIAEMFALGQAESDFSIGIESYDWEFFNPIVEDVTYAISARVTEAERRGSGQAVFDRIQFQFDVAEPQGTLVARSTVTWRYGRTNNGR